MARFTTRVELHNGTGEDYNALHDAMESAGFSRLIQGSDGVWHHMPWAEYNLDANVAIETVRDRASQAAAATGCKAGVLVTEGTRAWVGLEIATAPANR